MENIEKLTEYFRGFPGIGPRQARRFVYFLLTRDSEYIKGLLDNIKEVRGSVKACTDCLRFFTSRTGSSLCEICSSKTRDESMLLIVAKDVDLEIIEKSHAYNGFYFILGGNIQLLDKYPERRARINELNKILERKINAGKLKEIILSFSVNSEGDHTAEFIKDWLKEKFGERIKDTKISILGRGLSSGTEIEYSDGNTIKAAILNRF